MEKAELLSNAVDEADPGLGMENEDGRGPYGPSGTGVDELDTPVDSAGKE